MACQDITIVNKLGLHARAAAKLVQTSTRFASDIRLVRDGRRVDGKSIMAVMMLAAGKGTVLTLEAEGHDADAALAALVALINDRFGESE